MPLTVLPDELLDIALRALLPPFTSESLTDTYVFTVPSDLLNVRLVSRRFHRLATPIAWRRAHLSLAKPSTSNSNTTKTDSKGKCTRAATDHPLRSLRRCQFLSEHPHLASHIRILILDLSEWHYSNNTSHARAALRAATASMTSLRTVLVWDADVLSVPDIQELLQKPMLRAVCLMDLNGAVFPAESKGLRMLHVANTVCPARLIRGAKETLECVSIEVARTRDVYEGGTAVDGKEATLKEMPWRTLKEVALVDCMDEREWVAFLEGFQIHKSLSLPTSLNELLIGHADGLELTRIHSLLKTFSSHPITRLTLFHLPLLDPALLTSICSSFPMLTHLTLLTESLLVAWPHPLDAYTRPLSTLKNLTVLSWNNFPLEQEHATNCFMNMCEDSLAKLYTRQVKAVVKRCKSVKQVRFVSMGEWVVDTCMVRKKGCARCGGCHGVAEGGDVPVLDFKGCKGTFGDWMRSEELGPVEVVRTTQTALHTRSWGTGSGVFEDI